MGKKKKIFSVDGQENFRDVSAARQVPPKAPAATSKSASAAGAARVAAGAKPAASSKIVAAKTPLVGTHGQSFGARPRFFLLSFYKKHIKI